MRCDLPVDPQAEEVAWHAFLTEEELTARLTQWEWVPDGLDAYHRLLRRRADSFGRPLPPYAPSARGRHPRRQQRVATAVRAYSTGRPVRCAETMPASQAPSGAG